MVDRYQFRLNILDILSDEATRLLITATDLNLVENTFDLLQLVERPVNLANIALTTAVRTESCLNHQQNNDDRRAPDE